MKKNALEWIVFAFGVVAILVVVLGLVRDAQAPKGPPDLRVEIGKTRLVGDLWIVPVTVRNLGGEAAQGVAIRAEAGEQTAEFDLEYVPRESERRGDLFFREAPVGLQVDIAGTGTP